MNLLFTVGIIFLLIITVLTQRVNIFAEKNENFSLTVDLTLFGVTFTKMNKKRKRKASRTSSPLNFLSFIRNFKHSVDFLLSKSILYVNRLVVEKTDRDTFAPRAFATLTATGVLLSYLESHLLKIEYAEGALLGLCVNEEEKRLPIFNLKLELALYNLIIFAIFLLYYKCKEKVKRRKRYVRKQNE